MSERWTGPVPCWDQATVSWNWAAAQAQRRFGSRTDVSAGMIAIANEKHVAGPIPALAFRTATADTLAHDSARFNAVLGFNYLHLVRDVPNTLRRIHALLAAEGLFISKTPVSGT